MDAPLSYFGWEASCGARRVYFGASTLASESVRRYEWGLRRVEFELVAERFLEVAVADGVGAFAGRCVELGTALIGSAVAGTGDGSGWDSGSGSWHVAADL
jgi:hypothetical protein